jgi:DNA-binding GntR family transcriptional regulator
MTNATLAESVAVQIQSFILGGQYLSGERLVELSLAKALHVSQNTVRDALRILEQDGWVVKRARRGVYVRKFSTEEAAEVFALLGAVEALVLGWAIEARTRATLTELRGLVETARKQAASGEGEAAIELLFRFHERMAEIAAKPFTVQLMQQLYNQTRLLEAVRQARVPRNFLELNAHIRRHESLFFYIEEGNTEGAQRLLREQIEVYAEAVQAALAMS